MNPGVEIDLARFMKLEQRQRDEAFGDRSDPEHGVGGDIAAGGDIGFADAARIDDVIPGDSREAASRT